MEEAEDADPTESKAHLAGEALEAFLVVLEEAALAVVLVAEASVVVEAPAVAEEAEVFK